MTKASDYMTALNTSNIDASDCEKITQDCDAEMARLSGIIIDHANEIIDQTHEIERLKQLLNGRDAFIVSKGLWFEFTSMLPSGGKTK